MKKILVSTPLLILLSVIVVTQFLNHTGFCYSEMRYPSKRELVDRFLFGNKSENLTEEEKIAKIKERGGEYPNCCRANGQFFKGFIGFSNNVLGNYIYEVETNYLQDSPADEKYPYYANYTTMDSCGNGLGNDDYGESNTEKNYKFNIEMIKQHWEGKRP